MKKYYYIMEFISREVSPTNTKHYTIVKEGLLKETKPLFDKFLNRHGYTTKGTTKSGEIFNAKGEQIGTFELVSQTL